MVGAEAGFFIQLVTAAIGASFHLVGESIVVGDVPLPLSLILKLCSQSRSIEYGNVHGLYLDRDRLPQVSECLFGIKVDFLRGVV